MLLIFLLVIALSFNSYQAKDLPSDVQKCKAGDVQCIAKVATDILRNSGINGRADLGIPPFEPFPICNLEILNEGEDQPVNLHLILKDIVVHGLSAINIEKVVGFEKNPKESKFEIYTIAPQLKIVAQYKSNGRVLVIPIHGDGVFNFDLENVKINIKFKPDILERDGKQYLNINETNLFIEPENATAKFERITQDGNPLGASFNKFLNENWQEFFKQIYPSINDIFLHVINNLISKPFELFSYDDIFLIDS